MCSRGSIERQDPAIQWRKRTSCANNRRIINQATEPIHCVTAQPADPPIDRSVGQPASHSRSQRSFVFGNIFFIDFFAKQCDFCASQSVRFLSIFHALVCISSWATRIFSELEAQTVRWLARSLGCWLNKFFCTEPTCSSALTLKYFNIHDYKTTTTTTSS